MSCLIPADTDPSVDRCGLSPDLHLADPADFSPKSSLSCDDSVCGRSTDYEDFWRPPSPSASPGINTHTTIIIITHDLINTVHVKGPRGNLWKARRKKNKKQRGHSFRNIMFLFCLSIISHIFCTFYKPQNWTVLLKQKTTRSCN